MIKSILGSLGEQIQRQELKDSDWWFDKINSMYLFTKVGNWMDHLMLKFHRSSAVLKLENDDKKVLFGQY